MSENGEIYTAGKKFYTPAGTDGMDEFHLCYHHHHGINLSNRLVAVVPGLHPRHSFQMHNCCFHPGSVPQIWDGVRGGWGSKVKQKKGTENTLFALVRIVTPAEAWEGRRCAHTAQLREIFISFFLFFY